MRAKDFNRAISFMYILFVFASCKQAYQESIAQTDSQNTSNQKMENNSELPENLIENSNILETYNQYLSETGYYKNLTQEDLKFISMYVEPSNFNTIAIKLCSNEYSQTTKNATVIETEKNELELLDDDNLSGYDLFTGDRREECLDYRILGNIEEYILDNNIEPLEFTTKKISAWNGRDLEFIHAWYGDEVVDCLTENGFPLPIYDVDDFYDAYQESEFYNPEKIMIKK